MSINVARFKCEGEVRWGVVRENKLFPISGEFLTTHSFIEGINLSKLKEHDGQAISINDVTLLSPITHNQQFVCQGANYRQHMIESGMNPDDKHYNMIFTKAQSCIVAANSPVIIPRHVRLLDYEVELGLVIRKPIEGSLNITEDDLPGLIAGLVIVNDYSARDIQIPQMQFYKGKSYRTFGPVGPWLCLLEPQDYSYLNNLQLTLSVDGEVRQDDNTKNLVFGPVETLNELSALQNFAPGDLIATGTPSGCALSIPSPAKQKIAALMPEAKKWEVFLKMQIKRPQYLKEGQQVEAKIRSLDGVIDLGIQSNKVIRES